MVYNTMYLSLDFLFPNENMYYLYVIVVVDDGDDADDETSLLIETKHSYSRKIWHEYILHTESKYKVLNSKGIKIKMS